MEEISSEKFLALLESGEEFIVDFYAEWCNPCKMLEPVLKNIENQLDGIKIYRIDVDKEGELADSYRVRAIPTLVYFKDGIEVDRVVGALSKSKLIKWIEFIHNGKPIDTNEVVKFLESIEKYFSNLAKTCESLKSVVHNKNFDEIVAIASIQPSEIQSRLLNFLDELKLK